MVSNTFLASNIDHPYSKPRYIVLNRDNKYTCSCLLFQREGLICRHIFKLISYHDISDIESVQICARWTKAYNTDSSNNAPENLNNLSILSIDDDIIHDYDGLEIVTSRKDLTILNKSEKSHQNEPESINQNPSVYLRSDKHKEKLTTENIGIIQSKIIQPEDLKKNIHQNKIKVSQMVAKKIQENQRENLILSEKQYYQRNNQKKIIKPVKSKASETLDERQIEIKTSNDDQYHKSKMTQLKENNTYQ